VEIRALAEAALGDSGVGRNSSISRDGGVDLTCQSLVFGPVTNAYECVG
jgi:hypothetical protein